MGLAAVLIRITRTAMLDVLHEDYIRFTRAKGVGERTVIFKHALRNASIPIVTVVGLQCGYLLGGAIVIEQVFALPASAVSCSIPCSSATTPSSRRRC